MAGGDAVVWATPDVAHCGASVSRLISHLPRRIAAPPRAGRDMLALHQERVGGEHGPVAHRDAVVDEGARSHRAAGAERGAARFVRAVLLRVALDLAALIEDTLVPDGGQG